MNTKFLTLCVAVSFFSSALLFVYFKNKVSKVDEKLNLMYDLIQTHANEKEQIQFYENMRAQNQVHLNEKIVVSDNELDNSDNDSDSEHEFNVENELVIGENVDMADADGVVKKIALSLNEEVEEVVDDIILNKLEMTAEINDEVNESINNIVNDVQQDSDENDLNINAENDSDNDSDNESDNDSDNDNEEDSENNSEEVNLVKQHIDYNTFRVVELKKMCADKELTNYSSLKKKQLVELLSSTN